MNKLDLDVVQGDSGRVTVTVTGGLVMETVEEFNSRLHSIPVGTRDVSLDLSGITEISSAGIGALVSRSYELIRSGMSVSLLHPAPQVARLLKHTSLGEILQP